MATLTSRSIPSLDGLRAISIALVLSSHSIPSVPLPLDRFPLLFVFQNGELGVAVFFVISGFLITRLLLKERQASGTNSLKRFYFRRFFRIFPPFYAYLAVLGVLWLAGMEPDRPMSFLRAATYSWNYYRAGGSWVLGHTWSLSLEEQFYLVWPVCLLLLGHKKSRGFAMGVILLSPLSRIVSYYLLPGLRGQLGAMLHTRLDTIMLGCLLALLFDDAELMGTTDRFLRPWILGIATFFVLILNPWLTIRFRGYYSLPFGVTLEGLGVAFVLLYVVRKPASMAGRFLNRPWIRHVGVISYSLYLWQQLFTAPGHHWFPLNVLAAFTCAELSFWFVEQPSLRLRDRLETALLKTNLISDAPSVVAAAQEVSGN